MIFFFKKLKLPKVRKAFLSGFTLIEAMAGIFILSVVVGGPMIIAGRAAQDVRISKDVFNTTYLAQEAIELLRFKRDTLFLECSDPTTPNCPLGTFSGSSGPVTEFPNEAAWRLFKNSFRAVDDTDTLCFSAAGCTFDLKSILTSPSTKPTDVYDPSDSNCSSLYQNSSMSLKAVYTPSALDYMYLCSSHQEIGSVDMGIKRVIHLTSTSTFSGSSYDSLYNDEVRVDVTVYYKYRGFPKSITVTDYIKPRS